LSASEPEWRLFAALVGARRLVAPDGSVRGRLVHWVLERVADALDWAYARRMPVSAAPPGQGLSGPHGKIDGPESGSRVRAMSLLWGWALDSASPRGVGVTAVRVYLDGVWKGTATHGIRRHDVADQFGPAFTLCGWEFALDLHNVCPGPHMVQVAAYSSVSGQETTYEHPLTVEAPLAAPGSMRFALFISGCPGDSMRYRCDHQAQQLQLLGITADVAAYGEVALGDVVDRYYVFVLHRVLLSQDVAWFVDQAHRRGRAVVYDTDDLVFDAEAIPFVTTLDRLADRERENFTDCVVRGRRALLRCDAVLVSTQPLCDLASRIHPRVVVSPNVVDRSMADHARAALRHRSQRMDCVSIAYLCGTPTHDRDFLSIADELIWALETYPVARLLTVGPLTLDARFDRFGERVEQLPLRPWDQLPALIGDVDISLAPLEADNPFTEAKSCIKYFEAALVGVPTIASPRPDFVRAIEHGVTGFLASTPQEWRSALASLIESPELRTGIGARAREDVLRHHTSAAVEPALLNRLSDVIGRPADDAPLSINWVVRGPAHQQSALVSRPVAGLAGYLAGRGHRVRIWVVPRLGGQDVDRAEFAAEIGRSSGSSAIETVVTGSANPTADVNIATDPSTAHLVATRGAAPYHAYFIEDASPAGEESFFLPLRSICYGRATAEQVVQLTGGPVGRIDPPEDDEGWAASGAQLERMLLQLASVGRVARLDAPEPVRSVPY
jgi:glycosyltransferase involved in cell wall biosynthesis